MASQLTHTRTETATMFLPVQINVWLIKHSRHACPPPQIRVNTSWRACRSTKQNWIDLSFVTIFNHWFQTKHLMYNGKRCWRGIIWRQEPNLKTHPCEMRTDLLNHDLSVLKRSTLDLGTCTHGHTYLQDQHGECRWTAVSITLLGGGCVGWKMGMLLKRCEISFGWGGSHLWVRNHEIVICA